MALWERCGFLRVEHTFEEDRQPTREGHKLQSYLLNAPLVPWTMCERRYVVLALGSHHGPIVRGIPLAVAAKERVTRVAYLHAQGRLHAIRSDSPGVLGAAAAVLRRAFDDPTFKGWLSSDHDTATMGTPQVQAILDLLYAFRDEVSRAMGVRMPSSMGPQYLYGQADAEASLS